MPKLLALIDFSDGVDAVLAQTEKLARALRASICLLHVAPPDPDFVGFEVGPDVMRDAVAYERREEHRELQQMVGRLTASGLEAKALLVAGPTVEKALEVIARVEAEMVVVGSHGHGAMYNLIVGSTAAGIIKASTAPVLVVPMRPAET